MKKLSDWSITKMVYHKENSLVALNALKQHVSKVIKALGIKNYKKQKFRTEEMNNRPKCSVLYRKYRDREFLLDDECYFTKRRTNANGNDNFYSNNKDLAPANIKFKKVA